LVYVYLNEYNSVFLTFTIMGRNDNKTNKATKKAPKDPTSGSKPESDYQAGKKSKSTDLDMKKKK